MALARLAGAEEIPRLRELVRSSPGYRPARRHLARAIARQGARDLEQGRPAIALRRARAAVQTEPAEASGHLLAGSALVLQGRNDEALAAIERAVELRPDRWLSHFQLSQALSAAGRHEDAMTALRKAIALNPEHRDLAAALAALRREATGGS